MTCKIPKIVVITPVKNEAWILRRFLSVTSRFADRIIIADQNSDDNSAEICKNYEKVTLIPNKSERFNEAQRQTMLIQAARRLVTESKIILALDADEILAADAVGSVGWQAMLKARPGTVLYFETPDLFVTPYYCLRHDAPRPLGYVDDGAEHVPEKIHSTRVPAPKHAARLYVEDVKVLHYAYCRIDAQRSKDRFYSVVENSMHDGIKDIVGLPLLTRRREYGQKVNYAHLGKSEPALPGWFDKWESEGIDMRTVPLQKYYWYDLEVLKYFKKYGEKRFWLEDIWSFDWEGCRLHYRSTGTEGIPDRNIKKPFEIITITANFFTNIYLLMRALKTKLFFKPVKTRIPTICALT
jgi:glycosyltransferase involved in cell wall biosynthesis